jgi:hypothetical protein
MPQNEGARVRDEIGFIRRQYRAQVAKLLILPQMCKRRRATAIESDGEGRLVSECAEKDQLLIIGCIFDLMSFEQNRLGRIATNQAFVTPHGNEATDITLDCIGEPVQILAALAAAVDKRPRKYILIFHPGDRVPA